MCHRLSVRRYTVPTMKLSMPLISLLFLATGWELVVAPLGSQPSPLRGSGVPLAPPPEAVVAPTPSQKKLKKVRKVKSILTAIRKLYREHALDPNFQDSQHTVQVQVVQAQPKLERRSMISAKGASYGYGGDKDNVADNLKYMVGSELTMECSSQHSCGGSNNQCDVIIQTM